MKLMKSKCKNGKKIIGNGLKLNLVILVNNYLLYLDIHKAYYLECSKYNLTLLKLNINEF